VSDGKSLDALLVHLDGSAQDRGLLRSLVYGTIRSQIRLEAVLAKLSSRPPRELDPQLHALLLVGLFQLLHTDIAAHAAVAETVEATRALRQPRTAGLVNAVLRRCQREGKMLTAQIDQDSALRTAHPPWLVEHLRRDWPHSYLDILDANNQHPPMWLRVNARQVGVDAYLQRLRTAGLDATRSEFSPEALLLKSPTDVHALPGFAAGDVSVQDAAAQLSVHLLEPQAGERVLDACAAPGGKACHLLELQPRIGELVALDISAERLRKVGENLARLKLAATQIVGDAADPKSWWDGRPFDCILLDVPCSATGVIRRHPDIKLLRRASDIPNLSKAQAQILRCSWPLLKPGGRLLYSSCSALQAETSDVVAEFLAEQGDASDITAKVCETLQLPRAESHPGLAIRAGQAQMDGFYYACIVKDTD
ncbi:MAG TPA: 16S rRNA (cytosine(967)-C(5))-methyltransferase RsmB, partial [Steroidobacteraceae bacterium]|nr:16S rRNA (cytosine(967)-C(5))-methyltransferase RsmB [Steroidobacteraceae bacterium]